jgi:nicotinamidase-related amidase
MEIDARTGALVLIDLMPRIIARETGPRTGTEVLAQCLALAEDCRKAGGLVVFVRVERPGVEVQPPGSDLDEACGPGPGEPVVVKRAVNAFHETDLHRILTERGVKTLVVAGLVTNFGVEATARTAADYGYDVVLPTDAMAGFSAEAHALAVEHVFPSLGEACASGDLSWRL